MAIQIDHQLREFIPHSTNEFPITYFHDELITLPDLSGPLHWHPDFEIASAVSGTLDYQVGGEHIILKPGDSIFVNGNMLHGIRQLSGDIPDAMPNVVFSGTLLAPETGAIYPEPITLESIAGAAGISRSEAGRCFNAYTGCSPIEALIDYRLQMAHQMLNEGALTLQQISDACGFNFLVFISLFREQLR